MIFYVRQFNGYALSYQDWEGEYQNLKNPHCMLIPTKPIKGLEGDYIFTDESSNVVELSRNKKSNIYCSGIQIINPFMINKYTEKVEDFKDVWNQLISLKELKISSILPDYWYAIDNLEQLNYINDIKS